jgi:hypothetical protein
MVMVRNEVFFGDQPCQREVKDTDNLLMQCHK